MLLTTTTMIASTSRIAPTPMVTSISRRTVVHHARPPRRPILNPPHSPKLPLPTSGTSQPHPPKLAASTPSTSSQSSPKTRSTILEGTNLTLHHSPPPSAPSYTTGSVPPFLQWLGGESVHLTGEEVAPRRKERKPEMEGGLGWTDGMIEQMREMRKKGLSRKAIAEGLSIPETQQHLIARAAPILPERSNALEKELSSRKEKWGYRKRLARESREKRRTFW